MFSGEIADNFQEIVTNKYGMRVVKYLMAARQPEIHPPNTTPLLSCLNLCKITAPDPNMLQKSTGSIF